MQELEEKIEETQENEESLEELLRKINNEPPIVKKGNLIYEFESEIGREDHRAFFYHTLIRKRPALTAALLAMPAVLALLFIIESGGVTWAFSLAIAIIIYIVLILLSVFRIEKRLKQMENDTPELLRLTKTKFVFYEGKVFNIKNGNNVSLTYDKLKKISVSKKIIVLYFENNKAMVIRSEDVDIAVKDEFINFIKSKIKGSKSK